MNYVEANGLLGTRLLTSDSDAGYVILEYSPKQRVFIDDRYDMYPTKLIYDYFTIADGKPGWSKLLDRYKVETVVWDPGSTLAGELNASANWHRGARMARPGQPSVPATRSGSAFRRLPDAMAWSGRSDSSCAGVRSPSARARQREGCTRSGHDHRCSGCSHGP